MKRILSSLFAVIFAAVSVSAATPAPQKLLPPDTLLVATVPDANGLRASLNTMPMMMLWNDPAMSAFAKKIEAGIKEGLAQAEKESGLKLADLQELFQGQITLGVAMPKQAFNPNQIPSLIVIVDSGAKADLLAKKFKEIKDKAAEGGQPLKATKIGGVEFFSPPGADGDKVYAGVSGSLLLIGNKLPALEKVIAAQGGAKAPSLSDNPAFKSRQEQFSDALGYFWVDAGALIGILQASIPETFGDGPTAISRDKTLAALGLNAFKSVGISYHLKADGEYFEMAVDAPKAERRGLFNVFAFEALDSGPLPFIGEDASEFSRMRFSPAKAWSQLEKMLTEISPAAAGGIGFVEGLLKQQDPDLDFRKNLIEVLGNDLIAWSKPPKGAKLEEISSQPSVFLIEATKPKEVINTIRSIAKLASPEPPLEREFLGRTIYTYKMPNAGNPLGELGEMSFHLTTSGGYIAVSTDNATLETYLRGPANATLKPLSQKPGLKEAANKVGGFNTGMFVYQNQGSTARILIDGARQGKSFLNEFPFTELFGRGGAVDPVTGLPGSNLSKYIDLKALPEYEKIEKYFGFSVSAMSITDKGYSLKMYSPRPSGLK
ncbi:MAG: hypothetical protein EXS24_06330 [Pedosphaera sp.]|nr:hypothetical protein [Pedosphaera sp.]